MLFVSYWESSHEDFDIILDKYRKSLEGRKTEPERYVKTIGSYILLPINENITGFEVFECDDPAVLTDMNLRYIPESKNNKFRPIVEISKFIEIREDITKKAEP